MCGICGIIRYNNAVDPADVERLSSYIAHRGPDGKGAWISEQQHVGIGHRRLSILDISEAGQQPMLSADGRYIIAFNGEIYNFIEIREQLIANGFHFNTESDTEVILNAYTEWGKGMMDKFNGMWAFALYDKEKEKLLLCRDRYGVKPLYYYVDETQFVFASEIAAIHKFIGNTLTLNDSAISEILNCSGTFHGTDQTYLESVKSLQAGHLMEYENKLFTIKKWYQFEKVNVPRSFKAQAQVLKQLSYEACKLRLRSDVPVGTCLSGGLDSGSIAAIISNDAIRESDRFSNFSHRGFCASFPNTPIDESKEARTLAEKLNLNFDLVPIHPPAIHELELAMSECDGPYIALSFFPIWKLYQYIKSQDISVTLDGQGPDELLGGYNFVYEAMKGAWQKKDPFWFADVYKTYAALGESEQISSKKLVQDQYRRFSKEKKLQIMNRIKDPVKNMLRSAGMYNKQQLVKLPEQGYSKEADFLQNDFDKYLFDVFTSSSLPYILFQYDRCSMASGVECRTPFLDYRIVEFIFSLPTKSKLGGGYTKRVLREAMKGILPDSTRLNKRKLGFTAPMVDWFKRDLKDWMLLQMQSDSFLNNKYFDGEILKKEYEDYLASDNEDWGTPWKFWPPVHLAWWLNEIKSYDK
jgi:asparagine synthase (glutamine-hydrolysing)